MSRKALLIISLTLVVSMLLAVGAVFAQQPTGEFEVVRKAVEGYLTSGKAPVIRAPELYQILNDGDPANDPFIVDVRKPEDYAKGYIANAINIFWRDIWKPENLAKLPKDKKIVTYCYTGHTGQVATTVLNLLGYDAVNLAFGIMGWTKKDEVVGAPRFDPATQPDYPVSVEPVEAKAVYEFPVVSTGKTKEEEIVFEVIKAYLTSGKAPVIKAPELYQILNDGDPANDPFIVDVRKAEDYAKGHIAGAIHIFWRDFWKPENLVKLPKDKKIVTYCYTGHTGEAVTTVLNLLGYDAVNLAFGIMGWTKKDEVVGAPRFDPATQPDYPVTIPALPVTGGERASVAASLFLIAFGGISLLAGVGGLFLLRRRAA